MPQCTWAPLVLRAAFRLQAARDTTLITVCAPVAASLHGPLHARARGRRSPFAAFAACVLNGISRVAKRWACSTFDHSLRRRSDAELTKLGQLAGGRPPWANRACHRHARCDGPMRREKNRCTPSEMRRDFFRDIVLLVVQVCVCVCGGFSWRSPTRLKRYRS